MQGRSWKIEKVCHSFESANEKRKNILKNCSDTLHAKVKRMANGTFVVKTRSIDDGHSLKKEAPSPPVGSKDLRKEKKRKAREKRAKNHRSGYVD